MMILADVIHQVASLPPHPTPLPTVGVSVLGTAPGVTIRGLTKVEVLDSGWAIFAAVTSSLAALASIAVAVATWRLAVFTKKLAKETRKSLEVSRVALKSEQDARAAEDRRHMNGFLPHITLFSDNHPEVATLFAKNIGPGLAWNLEPSINISAEQAGFVLPIIPVALAPGDQIVLCRRDSRCEVEIRDIAISYQDVFGRPFKTRIDGSLSGASSYAWDRPPL